jgi:hypothetical protein
MKRVLILTVLILCTLHTVAGEEPSYTPAPYEKEEFPEWMHVVRRAEIVLIGSIPITLFFSKMGYQLVRYGINDFNPDYLPELFGNHNPIPLTEKEKRGILISTIIASGVVALTDFILGEVEKAREERDS